MARPTKFRRRIKNYQKSYKLNALDGLSENKYINYNKTL